MFAKKCIVLIITLVPLYGDLCNLLCLFLAVAGRAEARILPRLSLRLVGRELIRPEKAIGALKGSRLSESQISIISSYKVQVKERELAIFIVAHTTFFWGNFEVLKVECTPLLIRTYTFPE